MKVAIVGTGRAGLGLARALGRAGAEVVVLARSRAGIARARRALGRTARVVSREAGLPPRAGVVLLCVPDGAIERAARDLATQARGRVVLHLSGASGMEPLASLRRGGAHVGAMHPLTVFPPPGSGPAPLKGVLFAIAGDPQARRAGGRLARRLGGHPVAIGASKRVSYHLAAALAANGLVALLDAAIEVARRGAGLSAPVARRGLVILAAAALAAVERDVPARALTGPVARGDEGTVRAHLAALEALGGDVDGLYRALSRRAVGLALRDRRLSPRDAAAMRRLLESGPPRSKSGRRRPKRVR